MVSELGPSRRRVLDAVTKIHAVTGVGVTVREVADETDLNVSTVHSHLKALRMDGLVTWNDGATRTLRPVYEEP